MIELAIGNLMCIIVATLCLGAAIVLAIFAKVAARHGGAVGFFVLAILFLCALSAVITLSGVLPGVSM